MNITLEGARKRQRKLYIELLERQERGESADDVIAKFFSIERYLLEKGLI